MNLKPLILLVAILLIGVSEKLCGQECKQAVITGEVRGEESYTQPFGESLELRLRPLKQHWGWVISVSPAGSDEDWTFPVTFPLRNGESQTFGTGYGTTAQQRLKWPAREFFLLNSRDYNWYSKRAAETLNSADPNDAGKYIAELDHVTVGRVSVEATDYDRAGPPEKVQWMKFKATVTVPQTFPGASGLSWSSVKCPARWQ